MPTIPKPAMAVVAYQELDSEIGALFGGGTAYSA